jgi:uncharacterized protein (DUF58 family)
MDWLLHPRRRWRQWWAERTGPLERTTLTQRNIYIVPTRAGLAFAVTVLVLLLASLNYQLSLGFALTFLLAGSAIASMHMTHNSLRGLTLHVKPPAPAFAGDAGLLEIVVTNPGAMRHGIGVGLDTGVRPIPLAYDEIAPQGQTLLHLAWPVPVRGLHALPMVRAETRFPFGLFKAWTLWRPAGQICVYPTPERPAPPWPESAAQAGTEQAVRTDNGGEFDGVRAYRRGDTMRQVVWKKAARTGELVSRESQQGRQASLWLTWSQVSLPDPEARLARLCAWVLVAEQAGMRYGLQLPGAELAPDHGPQHRSLALRALAEWS